MLPGEDQPLELILDESGVERNMLMVDLWHLTVSHFYTPGMPTLGARQMAMNVASNFIKDNSYHKGICYSAEERETFIS